MSDITITNQLAEAFTVYDSYQATDANDNYYGTLTALSALAAKGNVSIPPPHPVSTLIIFDDKQKPLARLAAGLSHYRFTISETDVQTMAQADAFVAYVGSNPDSTEAKTIHGLKAAADIDAFFKRQPSYKLVTTPTYMLALTYRAQNPAPAGTKPEDVTYSLSKLITWLSGVPCPAEMPDITISRFFYQDNNGVLQFGGTVDVIGGLPFDPLVSGIIAQLLALTGPVNVRVSFDTEIGLNLAGTQVMFAMKEVDVPVGGGGTLRIVKPTVTVTINPLFKFVIFEVQADFPITVFGQEIDTHLSMVVDNVEIEVGLDVTTPGMSLQAPPPIIGVHLDSFGLGMGLIFEPPGYALGVQGSFHIGEGANVVSLDDDTFVVVLDIEEEIPVPMYLSFCVPKLDIGTVLTVLTDLTITVPIPIEFEDLSFTWNANPMEPVALPDGTFSKGGYGFSAYMDIFGLRAYADAEISLNGVTIDAVMAPVNLAGIFKLTGQGAAVSMKFDAQGNPIRANFIPKTAAERAAIGKAVSREIVSAGGPIVHVSTATSPYVLIDAQFDFLGLSRDSFHLEVTDQGYVFDIVGTLLPVVTFDVHGHFDSTSNFGAGGAITVGFVNETIDLGLSSGPFTLDTYAKGSLDVSYDGEAVKATFGFSFVFQGQSLEVAVFELDVDTGPLGDIWSIVKDKIIWRLQHADITLFIDNTVQNHLDQPGSGHLDAPGVHTDQPGSNHVDQSVGSHIDNTVSDWHGNPMSHQDANPTHTDQAGSNHVDNGTSHLDQPGSNHLDSPTQHQDQYYHVDQGVETSTKPSGAKA